MEINRKVFILIQYKDITLQKKFLFYTNYCIKKFIIFDLSNTPIYEYLKWGFPTKNSFKVIKNWLETKKLNIDKLFCHKYFVFLILTMKNMSILHPWSILCAESNVVQCFRNKGFCLFWFINENWRFADTFWEKCTENKSYLNQKSNCVHLYFTNDKH